MRARFSDMNAFHRHVDARVQIGATDAFALVCLLHFGRERLQTYLYRFSLLQQPCLFALALTTYHHMRCHVGWRGYLRHEALQHNVAQRLDDIGVAF